jgi:hypothetical protein
MSVSPSISHHWYFQRGDMDMISTGISSEGLEWAKGENEKAEIHFPFFSNNILLI